MKPVAATTTCLILAALTACKSAPPAAPDAAPASAANDTYNSTYNNQSHRHRHRSRSASPGEAPPDESWTSYDRPESATTGFQPRSHMRSRQQHHNSRATSAAPGQFDFYVLNLSWSPEFCHSHPNAAECAQHRAFTLHGLWPQNDDGTYPEDCSDATGPANPSQYSDIYPDAGLLQHEWQTHGTCSGLQPDQFLTLDRRAEQSIQVPANLQHLTQSTSRTPAQIITDFTGANPGLSANSLALSCGNNYLTAVEVCLDKNLKPQACQNLKTCGATSIRIAAPQQ